MTAIVCIEDRGGILFLNRRVGRDIAVCRDIAKDHGTVCMTEYSLPLFQEVQINTCVRKSPLSDGELGDVCFIENGEILNNINKISHLIIYRWNRRYPSDVKLGFEPQALGFKLVSTVDFEGQAHEKITKEIYLR